MGPMGLRIPMTMRISRPISRPGVRIFPTMSTTADCRMHSSRISAKNSAENSTGLKPATSGQMDIS